MEMQHLKHYLVAKGKTQSDLARALGRDKSAITNLFKGKRQLKAQEISLIADFLGITQAEVLGGAQAQPELTIAASESSAAPSPQSAQESLAFYGMPSPHLRDLTLLEAEREHFRLMLPPAPRDAYLLEVDDRGLDLEGLLPGDLVLCHPRQAPEKGDIVVVQLRLEGGGLATGLRLFDAPYLRPHSSEEGHQQLHVDRASVKVLAVVIRLIRLY